MGKNNNTSIFLQLIPYVGGALVCIIFLLLLALIWCDNKSLILKLIASDILIILFLLLIEKVSK